MQTSKKRLMIVQAFALLLLASCSTPTYTYYYSVLKQKDNRTENNFKKGELNEGRNYSRYPIHNLLNDTASNNDSVLYFLDISKANIGTSVQNKIPIFLDSENSFISINHSNYKFSTLNPKKNMFDKIENILTIYPDSFFNTLCINSSFVKRIPLDSFLYYDKYNYNSLLEKRNYMVRGKNTVNLPVIKFTEENTPLKIEVYLVYYTDTAYIDKHEVKTEFYQSELMILKGVRFDNDRQKNCYYMGEIIGDEVKDISFYTKTKTGAVTGWPEIRLGLGKTTYWILSPLLIPIEIVRFLANRGPVPALVNFPLFE